jgi:ribosomal protein L40E
MNYYEMLEVESSATGSEIETVIEDRYNYWRRLVNHHDPTTVDEANRSLRTLEAARETLLDPVRRAEYNESLGLATGPGGLADPSAVGQSIPQAPAPMTPPPPKPATVVDDENAKTSSERVDAWVCPKCGTANPVGTKFCKNDGEALGRACPNCQSLNEASAEYCSYCGSNVKELMRQKQLAYVNQVQGVIRGHQTTISQLEGIQNRAFALAAFQSDKELKELTGGQSSGVNPFLIGIGLGIVVLCISISANSGFVTFLGLLAAAGLVAGAAWYSQEKAKTEAAKAIRKEREAIAELEKSIREIQSLELES